MTNSGNLSHGAQASQTTPDDGHGQTRDTTDLAPRSIPSNQDLNHQILTQPDNAHQAALTATSANRDTLTSLTGQNDEASTLWAGDSPANNWDEPDLNPFLFAGLDGSTLDMSLLLQQDGSEHFSASGSDSAAMHFDLFTDFPSTSQLYQHPPFDAGPAGYAPAVDPIARFDAIPDPQPSIAPTMLSMQLPFGPTEIQTSYPLADPHQAEAASQYATAPATSSQDDPNGLQTDADYDNVEDREGSPKGEAVVRDAAQPKTKDDKKDKPVVPSEYAKKSTYSPMLDKDVRNEDGTLKYKLVNGILQFPRAARPKITLRWTPYHPDKYLLLHQLGYFAGRGGNKDREKLAEEMLNRPTDPNHKVYIDAKTEACSKNIILKVEKRYFKQFVRENIPEGHPSSAAKIIDDWEKLMEADRGEFRKTHQGGYLTRQGIDWDPHTDHDESFDADNELRVKTKPKGKSSRRVAKPRPKKSKAPAASSGEDHPDPPQTVPTHGSRSDYRPMAPHPGYQPGPATPHYPLAAAGREAHGPLHETAAGVATPPTQSRPSNYTYNRPQYNGNHQQGSHHGNSLAPTRGTKRGRVPDSMAGDSVTDPLERTLKKLKSSNTHSATGHHQVHHEPPPPAPRPSYPDPAAITQVDRIYWGLPPQNTGAYSRELSSYASASNGLTNGVPRPSSFVQQRPTADSNANRRHVTELIDLESTIPRSGNGDSSRTSSRNDGTESQTPPSTAPSSLPSDTSSTKRKRARNEPEQDEGDTRTRKVAKTDDQRSSPILDASFAPGSRRFERANAQAWRDKPRRRAAPEQGRFSGTAMRPSTPMEPSVVSEVYQFDGIAALLLNPGTGQAWRPMTVQNVETLRTIVGPHDDQTFYYIYLINADPGTPEHVYQARLAYFKARYHGIYPT